MQRIVSLMLAVVLVIAGMPSAAYAAASPSPKPDNVFVLGYPARVYFQGFAFWRSPNIDSTGNVTGGLWDEIIFPGGVSNDPNAYYPKNYVSSFNSMFQSSRPYFSRLQDVSNCWVTISYHIPTKFYNFSGNLDFSGWVDNFPLQFMYASMDTSGYFSNQSYITPSAGYGYRWFISSASAPDTPLIYLFAGSLDSFKQDVDLSALDSSQALYLSLRITVRNLEIDRSDIDASARTMSRLVILPRVNDFSSKSYVTFVPSSSPDPDPDPDDNETILQKLDIIIDLLTEKLGCACSDILGKISDTLDNILASIKGSSYGDELMTNAEESEYKPPTSAPGSIFGVFGNLSNLFGKPFNFNFDWFSWADSARDFIFAGFGLNN